MGSLELVHSFVREPDILCLSFSSAILSETSIPKLVAKWLLECPRSWLYSKGERQRRKPAFGFHYPPFEKHLLLTSPWPLMSVTWKM